MEAFRKKEAESSSLGGGNEFSTHDGRSHGREFRHSENV
ncbi:hypothetical protein HMPREF9124_2342 [Oribacterium sp. oral taxon 108 str. F0425]|nr:hypothetical protein HMPREF9124_2342 [Oribacterium sp. oral taxon 108 str. F0425]